MRKSLEGSLGEQHNQSCVEKVCPALVQSGRQRPGQEVLELPEEKGGGNCGEERNWGLPPRQEEDDSRGKGWSVTNPV